MSPTELPPVRHLSRLSFSLARFLCLIGWHVDWFRRHHDGVSMHAECRHCGYEGMIDSQGNLF